ncbi:DUF3307 domain-containing protein [Tropicimonas sediminicola]|uniref:DUF3307 domain-containing protein n=1 Tax=Tropicimonas sediminicola TaxID=1031541 RepID=A0A239LQQ8_9RHOB|nr:DUF3307 domain-containing protein [Tropicimonas sediminicola]SNT32123.1 Protein of unknown function [Tropicimonas sediminicola]
MSVAEALWLLAALQAKHLIADFFLQTGYMHANKGRYGHPGGLMHAGLHGLGSLCVLLAFGVTPLAAAALTTAEFLVHYHLDWAKARLTANWRLTPDRPSFWALIGVDQALHQWTYLVLVILVKVV